MNIVIIGGGVQGRFGNDLALRFRQDGHRVKILSHVEHPGIDQYSADFTSYQSLHNQFELMVADLDSIDIFVYNTTVPIPPWNPDEFKSSATVDIEAWNKVTHLHVIVPHLLSIKALNKMSEGSKLIFMTSALAIDWDNMYNPQLVGYASGKAAQTHLMRGLGLFNDKKAIATALHAPFDYHEPDYYKSIFERCYQYILTCDSSDNAKIKKIH
jgi:NAD(P)-dependent dehydrogenase (short-subunit alcohol dehydrogenase family)